MHNQIWLAKHQSSFTVCLGEVYAVGRSDYGRLGFPTENTSNSSDKFAVAEPHLVQGLLKGRKCSWVGAGESCSYAVDESGKSICLLKMCFR